jgi:hypothetical protein
VAVLGALYWIPGGYLMVTGHSVPNWVLWPFKNPKPKGFMRTFGAAMFVIGVGFEIGAIATESTSAAATIEAAAMTVLILAAVLFLFGGIVFARESKPAAKP